MSNDNDKLETLKVKLKKVIKNKLSKEREVLKLRNKERLLSDELSTLKADVDYLSDQLEIIKTQLTQSKHQISMIEICMTSEDVKIGAHSAIMNDHLNDFQQLFDKERKEIEKRINEEREREAVQLELIRQKEKQIAEEIERQQKEATAIEEECDVIERECAVLKKRNNAILLKLRKKLLETEHHRRERVKRNQ